VRQPFPPQFKNCAPNRAIGALVPTLCAYFIQSQFSRLYAHPATLLHYLTPSTQLSKNCAPNRAVGAPAPILCTYFYSVAILVIVRTSCDSPTPPLTSSTWLSRTCAPNHAIGALAPILRTYFIQLQFLRLFVHPVTILHHLTPSTRLSKNCAPNCAVGAPAPILRTYFFTVAILARLCPLVAVPSPSPALIPK